MIPRLDLSDNTNRWGMPPSAERALRQYATTGLSRYPDAYATALKQAIASYCDVDADRVVTGCGSDDVLDAAIRACRQPGDALATIAPSFTMIPLFAQLNALDLAPVPLLPSWDIDAEGLLATRATVTYLCSPNNPTGTLASRASVERVVDGAAGIVIMDEAYTEFTDANFLDLARTRTNVLVVRTLSKAFGLAGLRVGYAIGDPALVRRVEHSRGPFKVTGFAAAAAIAALGDGREWVSARAALARDARQWLTARLRERGMEPAPAFGNFVFVPLPDAPAVVDHMRSRGVAVRAFPNGLRITVGPPHELVDALDAFDAAMLACV